MEKPAPEILQTKQHFEILDGLRGVAALAVVTFHFMEMAYSDYSGNFIGHGFLRSISFSACRGLLSATLTTTELPKWVCSSFLNRG